VKSRYLASAQWKLVAVNWHETISRIESAPSALGERASCEQEEFVSRNGKFCGDFWLAAIQTDQQRWKDEHEGFVQVRQMDRSLGSDLFLIF